MKNAQNVILKEYFFIKFINVNIFELTDTKL